MTRVLRLDDASMRSPSLLPGWSVAHVLTHLARNADAHARRLSGALRGEEVPKYEGGERQRTAEIDAGSGRSAVEILRDLAESQARLEALFEKCESVSRPNPHFRGGDAYGVAACPAHRLREVEMHHVDLDLGYGPADWPDEYVEWDLAVLLATVPGRMDSQTSRGFMAWLARPRPTGPGRHDRTMVSHGQWTGCRRTVGQLIRGCCWSGDGHQRRRAARTSPSAGVAPAAD